MQADSNSVKTSKRIPLHHGAIFRQKLKDLDLKIDEFALAIGKSRHAVYKLKDKKVFSVDDFALVCMFLSMDITEFGEDPDYFNKLVKDDKLELQVTFIKKSDNGRSNDPEQYVEFLHRYFDKLEETVAKAKSRIVAVDHLADNWMLSRSNEEDDRVDERLTVFHKRNSGYLNLIEQKLRSNPDLEYSRFVQLPLHPFERGCQFDKPVIRAIDLCYPENILHFHSCFQIDQNKNDNMGRFKLYCLPTPLRMFSYLIVDNHFLATEMDTCVNQTDLMPDLLFTESASQPSTRELIDNYNLQLKYAVTGKVAIDIETTAALKGYLESAWKTYSDALTLLESRIKARSTNLDSYTLAQSRLLILQNADLSTDMEKVTLLKERLIFTQRKMALLSFDTVYSGDEDRLIFKGQDVLVKDESGQVLI